MEEIQYLLELIKDNLLMSVSFLFGFILYFWVNYKTKQDEERKRKEAGRKQKEENKKEKQEKREKKKQEKIEKERLIKKYGELDGLLIFDGTISEKEFLRKKKIIKKYGEDIGEKIFYKILFIDMTKEMVIDALGNPSDIKETVTREKTTNKYYYHPRKTRQSTTVYRLEVTLENDVVSGWKDLE
tara:strand:- start:68 stop:622 length:555 start_codon:yes stop_codon:yes gene_type:complete